MNARTQAPPQHSRVSLAIVAALFGALTVLAAVVTIAVPRTRFVDLAPSIAAIFDRNYAFAHGSGAATSIVDGDASVVDACVVVPPRAAAFRIAVFTDMHFGEDAHLDALTVQLQRLVLRSHPDGAPFDLLVLMGDDVSQEDYLPLRRPSGHGASSDGKEETAAAAAAAAIPSCLRDPVLGAKRCWREAHRALCESGVPVCSLIGNHDARPPHDESTRDDGAIGAGVTLDDLVRDARSFCDALATRDKTSASARTQERTLFTSANVDGVFTVIVPDAAAARQQPVERDCKRWMRRNASALAHLVLFNSVSDESDTLLLHGYKYPSPRQIRQAKQIAEEFAHGSGGVAAGAGADDLPPLRLAFVHVPPPIFLSRASVTAAGGAMNETPGCAPRALAGPRDFSRFLVQGGESESADGVDVVVVGHDHKNDEWAVHDRERIGFGGSDELPPAIRGRRRRRENVARPLHLAYGRHSGFGGYFDMASSRLPGVRVIEIGEEPVVAVGRADTAGDVAALVSSKCAALGREHADLKLCRAVRRRDGLVVAAFVRSWVLEAVVGAPRESESGSDAAATAAQRKREAEREAFAKAREPAERLLHSELRGRAVVGLRRIDQELRAVARSAPPGVAIGTECAGANDYRVQFGIAVACLWACPAAIVVAVLVLACRQARASGRSRKLPSEIV